MKMLSLLKKSELSGKIALLRIDLNIKDDDLKNNNLRIISVLPSIKFLLKNRAKVVIISHRGRPLITRNNTEQNYTEKFPRSSAPVSCDLALSLKPFARIISKPIKTPVYFARIEHINKADIQNSFYNVFLLENIRFYEEEEKNDFRFAQKIAFLGDLYVNDAFAVSHRANASVAAITNFLPSYAGLLLEKETKNLDAIMKTSKNPLTVILGGAKISDKIGMIKNFISKAGNLLVSGGIATTIMKANGLPIGDSICEDAMIEFAKKISKSSKIVLPEDVKIENRKILDIGPKTIEKFGKIIKKSRSIIWNGPMGYFEDPKFRKGSEAIAAAILQNKKAFSVIGGGETAVVFQTTVRGEMLNERRTIHGKIPHKSVFVPRRSVFVSTGGGAMLEYLAGKKLPGVQALESNRKNMR